MRLTELEPRWYSMHGRSGRVGMLFLCPHCRVVEIPVAFENPMDGAEPDGSAKCRWQRTGDTFETITLSPSVDASGFGCWHGWIKDGEVT